MKVLLVYPRSPNTFWSFKHAIKFISKEALHPPLGLLTVSAMLPKEWEKKLIDMNITELRNRDIEWADYVILSSMAIQKKSVDSVISKCKKLGTRIIAGGPLFTADHENYSEVDHLILNEAEITLPLFLEDFKRGKAKQIYCSNEFPNIESTPIPDWELINMKKYFSMTIQYSRGCPFNCDFCDITSLYGHKPRTKTKKQIIDELEELYIRGWTGNVFFVDDNLIGNKQQLKSEILPAVIKWMKEKKYPYNFSTEISLNLADDDELLEMLVEAGFDSLFVGIETPNEESLAECNKFQNQNRDLVACIQKIQDYGLEVHGGFIVGFDNDTSSIFENQINLIQKSRIITAMVGMLNAPKGTKLYTRIKNEGRLIKETTGDNTDFTTNIMPKMGMDKLTSGYKYVINGVYSAKPYYQRVKEYIKGYKPLQLQKVQNTFFKNMSIRPGYIGAFFKAFWFLGIKDKERNHYWKFIVWTIFKYPHRLNMAIIYAIYGFHFRKVFEKIIYL